MFKRDELGVRLEPPTAEKRPFASTFHGVTINDSYHWLRDPGYPKVNDPKILAHLNAENDYYQGMMAPHKDQRNSIYEELIACIKQDDSSVPHKYGEHLYWWKFEEGEEYRRWYRSDLHGKREELILDEVALAKDSEYFRLGGLSLSPDHSHVAWSSDTDGSERFTIHLKNIRTGDCILDIVEGSDGSIVWATDGSSFLYTFLSEEHRPYKVLLHKLGTATSNDVLLYEEKDPSFFLHIGKTSSRKFITIVAGDHVSTEVRLLPSDEPESPALLIAERRAGHEYTLDDCTGGFVIRSNDTHRNFRMVTASFENPSEEHWTEVISPSNNVYITDFQTFKEFYVIEERIDGQEQIRVRGYDGTDHAISFPEPSFSVALGVNAEFDSDTIRLGYDSMVTPPSVLEFKVSDKTLKTLKEQKIPSGYNKDAYSTERLMATSHDGTLIPISLVYKKGIEQQGARPLHLYAYGAYGMAMAPSFSSARLSLLDRGFSYAIAHIRGGDEMGYHWYEEGKLFQRTNTFLDFIACAEHLVSEGYANKGEISISGGSAGGTLMGAVTNMHPSMWKAVVAHVPFVDVLNTMLDDTLPLTPIEWPEWGNPIVDKKAFDYILSYSPYENIEAKDYPMIFVTAGLNDPRVTYWEPAKWVAKLREEKTNDNVLFLKTNMGAGHGGKSGRFERYFEVAEEYTFVLKAFDLI